MSCPGLHHASCGRGGSAATLAVTGMLALAAWWAFEDPVAVIMTVAASLVLSVAMVGLLARAMARREASMGRKLAAWRQAQAPGPGPGPGPEPRPERRAVAGAWPRHLPGLPDTDELAAAIIRRAISGPNDPGASDGVAVQAVPNDAVAAGASQRLRAFRRDGS
jgi:hypothetical protein